MLTFKFDFNKFFVLTLFFIGMLLFLIIYRKAKSHQTKKKLIDLFLEHHHIPKIDEKKRYKGILLSSVSWFLFAIFTHFIVKLSKEFSSHISTKTSSKIFIEFSIIHFVMMMNFLVCSLKSGGIKHLIPRDPKLITVRSICALAGFCFYSIAAVWTTAIDNSLLFSTDALWVIIILWIINKKTGLVPFLGAIVSFGGVVYTYCVDSTSFFYVWGVFLGALSGFTLAIITVITAYLVQQDPPIRIGFHQGMWGTILCLFITGIEQF